MSELTTSLHPAAKLGVADMSRSPGRVYFQIIASTLVAGCGIGLLVQPLTAWLSGFDPYHAAIIWFTSGVLWWLAREVGVRRVHPMLRTQVVALSVLSTIIGLYICNQGIFGTVVDPGLLAFGLAMLTTLDGSRMTLAAGAAYYTLAMAACTIWLPSYYFGLSTAVLPLHAAFHTLWWSVPLLFGHLIGRRVKALIGALVESRRAEQQAREREAAAAAASEQVRERAANERLETLNAIAAAFDEQVQSSMVALLSLANMVEVEASSAVQAALGARTDGDTVAALAGEASAESNAAALATERVSESVGRVRTQIAAAAAAGQTAMQIAADSDRALGHLTESARRVDSIVEIIRGVAQQTKLLAINASIEAAHAGHLGHGFAVVAAEVKRLASQTTAATAEIAGLVAEMKSAVAHMTDSMRLARQTATSVSNITGTIALAMNEQASATDQIARTVSAVAERMAATASRVTNLIELIRKTSDANATMLEGAAAMRASSAGLQSRAAEFGAQLNATPKAA